ncbi:MAG: hypothetical protein LC658_09670 [Bacteroidales bacterium]|nr:hypothetical protein [Bacteroidales bacterium]
MLAVSDITAWFLSSGGKILIIGLLAFSGLAIYQVRKNFNKKNLLADPEDYKTENEGIKEMMQKCKEQLTDSLQQANIIYTLCLSGFLNENLTTLKDARKVNKLLNRKLDMFKNKIFHIATVFEKNSQSGHYYLQFNDYQMRMIRSLALILDPLYEHLGNSHKPFIKPQAEELSNLMNDVNLFISRIIYFIKNDHLNDTKNLTLFLESLNENLENMGVEQIKRIKTNQINTRNSILFLNILSETKNMLNHTSDLFNSYIHLATDLINENPNKTKSVILL